MTLFDEANTAATTALARSIEGVSADDVDHDYYRKHVAIALSAALEVLCDEPTLAGVIHKAACGTICSDSAPMRVDWNAARAVAAHMKGVE